MPVPAEYFFFAGFATLLRSETTCFEQCGNWPF